MLCEMYTFNSYVNALLGPLWNGIRVLRGTNRYPTPKVWWGELQHYSEIHAFSDWWNRNT